MANAGTVLKSSSQVQGINASLEIDADAFMASLAAEVAKLKITTRAGLWKFGFRIRNNAVMLAPVDTGRLRSSITATLGSDAGGAFVDVGTNVEYAAYVEFGTIYMAAQPYLRPAIALAVGYLATDLKGTG